MNILVIGSNGREHALAVTYAKSKGVKKVVMTPGNGLTDFSNPKINRRTIFSSKIKNYPEVRMMDFEAIVKVCKREKIDLVDVAQDDIIAAGYVDRFEKLGIRAFGPTQKASQIEWDKKWAREFMEKYNLPIPQYKTFNNQQQGIKYIDALPTSGIPPNHFGGGIYIKAAGLAGGKGAIRAENKKAAIEAILSMRKFGKAGETFLVEQALYGEEFSLFAICDGINFKIISWAQDYKTVYDGDLGPNTGGMGSVAPAAVITKKIVKEVEKKILTPLMEGMQKEGRPYKGILYLGGMLTRDGVKIIEFNARWGDPEAETILPGIKTDYLNIVTAVLSGKLKSLIIKVDSKVRISLAGCSKGYPGDYSKVKGKQIFGLEKAMNLPGITIFGAGIKRNKKKFFANGGRLFYIVGEGKDILEARKKAYSAMSLISIEGDNLHYRTDIGKNYDT